MTLIHLSRNCELLVGFPGCRDIVMALILNTPLDECRNKFVSVATLFSCFSRDFSRLCHDVSCNVAT